MSPPRFRDTAATVLRLCGGVARFVSAAVRSHAHLAAENLFLRKQLALYVEHQVKPRRADDATRIALVALSWLVHWRRILTIVQQATLMRWHRQGFRLFWRWKSRRRGRPPVPAGVRRLIVKMASANRSWGLTREAHPPFGLLVCRHCSRSRRHFRPSVQEADDVLDARDSIRQPRFLAGVTRSV